MITPMLCEAKSMALKPYAMSDETDMPKQQIENVQKEPSKKPIRKITGKVPAAALIALLTAGGLTGCSSDNNIKKDDSLDTKIEKLEKKIDNVNTVNALIWLNLLVYGFIIPQMGKSKDNDKKE